tara:strand:+ start:26184 stop:26723 length:540 start_codon:yes stop_codon:yes gene_type:complete
MVLDYPPMESIANNASTTPHKLSCEWTLWSHLPHNTDWSTKSYLNIGNMHSLESATAITEALPDLLIENCMLFVMRDGISPTWEDVQNRHGGSFSYKVSNRCVHRTWRDLTYTVLGNTISSRNEFVNNVTGITISPKKNFCIIKIWMCDCKNQNPSDVTTSIKDISSTGCIFKKHAPEY